MSAQLNKSFHLNYISLHYALQLRGFGSRTNPNPISLLLLLFLSFFSSKSQKLSRLKSDRGEIWQNYSSSKYESTDEFWFLIQRHTFKMAAMTSARRLLLNTAASVGCPLVRRVHVTSLAGFKNRTYTEKKTRSITKQYRYLGTIFIEFQLYFSVFLTYKPGQVDRKQANFIWLLRRKVPVSVNDDRAFKLGQMHPG